MPKVVSISGKLKKPLFGMKVPAWLALSAPQMQERLAPVYKSVFLDTEKQFKAYLKQNDNSVESGRVSLPGAQGTFDTGALSESLTYTFEVRRTRGETKFYYRVGSDAEHFKYLDEGFNTGDEGINLEAVEDWMKRRGSAIKVAPMKRRRPGFAKRKNASTKTSKERAWESTVAKIWNSTRDREYRGLFLRRKLLQFYDQLSRQYGLPSKFHAVLWRPTDSSGFDDDN